MNMNIWPYGIHVKEDHPGQQFAIGRASLALSLALWNKRREGAASREEGGGRSNKASVVFCVNAAAICGGFFLTAVTALCNAYLW